MPLIPANPQAPGVALEYIRRVTGKVPQALPSAPAATAGTITTSNVYLTDTRTLVDLGFSAVASVSGSAVFQTWVQDFCVTKTVFVPGDGPLMEVVFGIGYRVAYSAIGWNADVNAGFSALAAKAHAEGKNLRLRVELIGLSTQDVDFPYMDIADTDFSLSTYGKLAQFGLAVNQKVKTITSGSLVPVAFSYRTTDLFTSDNVENVARSTLFALWQVRQGRTLAQAVAKLDNVSEPIDVGAVRAIYAHMLNNPGLLGPGGADASPIPSAIQQQASQMLVMYNV